MFRTEDFLDDVNPPYWTNYGLSWLPTSIQWKSIVFHCHSNKARVACANINVQPLGTFVCNPDSEDFDGLSELDYCLLVSTLLLLVYGVYYKMSGKGMDGDKHGLNHALLPTRASASLPSNLDLDEGKALIS